MTDPTKRFSGLAQTYAKARPTYPSAAIDYIVCTCKLEPGKLVVDVGCGTGISSRLFASLGFNVIGLEPNADMRKQAEEQDAERAVEYRDGTAEHTGLPDATANLVLAAQAFHWFSPDPTLKEFCRILKRDGWVALVWNERDEANGLTRGYGDALRKLPETANVEMKRGIAGEPLLECDLFADRQKRYFPNSQRLELEGFLGRAFSASYVPQSGAGADALRAELTRVFEANQTDGFAEMLYSTSVYLARKSG